MQSITVHFSKQQMRTITEYASLLGLTAEGYVTHALRERLENEMDRDFVRKHKAEWDAEPIRVVGPAEGPDEVPGFSAGTDEDGETVAARP